MSLYFWRFFISDKIEKPAENNTCPAFSVLCFPHVKLMFFEVETYVSHVGNVWLGLEKHKIRKTIE